jgi:hypothetical protein
MKQTLQADKNVYISSHAINMQKQWCAKAKNGGNGGLFGRLVPILTELKGNGKKVKLSL